MTWISGGGIDREAFGSARPYEFSFLQVRLYFGSLASGSYRWDLPTILNVLAEHPSTCFSATLHVLEYVDVLRDS